MQNLVLLGDSVIDNSVYLAPGQPDTHKQIAALVPDTKVTMRAVDGFVASDVTRQMISDPLPAGVPVFLSAGGNDALGSIGLLGDTKRRSFADSMEILYETREQFRLDYAKLLNALAGRKALIATIYAPNFSGPQEALQRAAEGALSGFNDVIPQEALARGFSVLDLRALFTDAADYANPIEPSMIGSGKIARAVAKWMERTG